MCYNLYANAIDLQTNLYNNFCNWSGGFIVTLGTVQIFGIEDGVRTGMNPYIIRNIFFYNLIYTIEVGIKYARYAAKARSIMMPPMRFNFLFLFKTSTNSKMVENTQTTVSKINAL